MNGQAISSGEQLTANTPYTTTITSSQGITYVRMYVHGQDISAQGQNPTTQVQLASGTYEMDVLGYTEQNGELLASAKIKLQVAQDTSCEENWVCGEWEECTTNCGMHTHQRTCRDENSCGYREPTTQYKTITTDDKEETQETTSQQINIPQGIFNQWPVDRRPVITSLFGQRTLTSSPSHAGIDIRARTIGEPVRSVDDGRIKSKEKSSIFIEMDNGYTCGYLHVTPDPTLLVHGRVSKGQQIATIQEYGGSEHLDLRCFRHEQKITQQTATELFSEEHIAASRHHPSADTTLVQLGADFGGVSYIDPFCLFTENIRETIVDTMANNQAHRATVSGFNYRSNDLSVPEQMYETCEAYTFLTTPEETEETEETTDTDSQTTQELTDNYFLESCRILESTQRGDTWKNGITFTVTFDPTATSSLQAGEDIRYHVQNRYSRGEVIVEHKTIYDEAFNTYEQQNPDFKYRLNADACREIQQQINFVTAYGPTQLTDDTPSENIESLDCGEEEKQALIAAQQQPDQQAIQETAAQLQQITCESKQQEAEHQLAAAQALESIGEDMRETYKEIYEEYTEIRNVAKDALYAAMISTYENYNCEEAARLAELFVEEDFLEATNQQTTRVQEILTTCTQTSPEGSCVLAAGQQQAPIKIVFIPHRYESTQTFIQHTQYAIQEIFTNSVLNEYRDLFAFYYHSYNLPVGSLDIDEVTLDEGVFNTINSIANHCPSHPVVLSREFFRSYAYHEFSATSWTEQDQDSERARVVLHEISHQLFDLPDLYVEAEMGSVTDFVCQPSREEAQRDWAGIPGVEYHEGCSYLPTNIRSSKESLMKNHSVTPEYSPAGAYVVQQKLQQLQGGVS